MNGHTRKQYLVVLAVMLVTLSGCGIAVPAFMAYEASQTPNDAEPSAFYGALPRLADDLNHLGPDLDRETPTAHRTDSGQYAWVFRPAMVLVERVTVDKEPEIDGNVATWESIPGMTTGNVWRFTARKVGSNAWDYALMGKDKTAPDAYFLAGMVMAGHTERNGSDVTGSVSFTWNVTQALPERVLTTESPGGTYDVQFNRTARAHTIDLSGVYVGGPLNNRVNVDLSMHYVRTFGQGGEMVTKQASPLGTHTARTRWDATGAMRSDTFALRPDGTTQYTSNCADKTGTGAYSFNSDIPQHANGSESLCPFGAAAFYMP